MTRTYVITGAGSGIGLATSELLQSAGHRVIGVDLRGAEVEADLGSSDGREKAASRALALADSPVDAVIACAGIVHPVPAAVSVNYFGMTEFLERMRPSLQNSSDPRAVLVSSVSAIQPDWPALTDAMLSGNEAEALLVASALADDEARRGLIYASSKRAISRWVRARAISADWAGTRIPLNAVAPGVVETPLTRGRLADPVYREQLALLMPMPLNGYQSPQTVAHLLVWLASVENTHCTGQTIFCDGGAETTLRGEDAMSWADERIGALYANLGRPTSLS